MHHENLAFVDIETSGSYATHDRIIEIGILRVENNKLVRTFSSLINPQKYVDPFIEQITGITTSDLKDAPTFEELKEEISEMLDDCIFVAHNVRFDYSFVKNEFRRFGMTFAPRHFCTVKLSRLLYPQHRRHGLDTIMERFQISCESRHRAFDDAKVVWDFYQKLQTLHDEESLEKAIQIALKRPSLPTYLPADTIDTLPEQPGVYIFYGESEVPLYIGKSINIRDRVLSHFSGDHTSAKEMDISQQIRRIETITTAGELGALLKEAELVKELKPLYNRHLRKAELLVLARQEENKDGYATITLEEVEHIEADTTSTIVGIFRTKTQAKEKLQILADKHQLCPLLLGIEKGRGPCFGYKIEKCYGACISEEKPLRYNLRFAEAFADRKIKHWPFSGPITITEHDEFEHKKATFLVNNWCIVTEENLQPTIFDYDTYKILVRYIFKEKNQASIHPLKIQPNPVSLAL